MTQRECAEMPTPDERLLVLRAHDQRQCTCGHKFVSHRSSDAGLGMGECGIEPCGCSRFEVCLS